LGAREKKSGGHDKSRDSFCTTLGGVASRGATQQQALGAGGTTNNSLLTNTGIICQEEMTATFCNTPTSPNASGYGLQLTALKN
jgi:hypothetical protein